MKGADAAKAGALLKAAERAGFALHLAVVHIGDTGSAEEDYHPGSRRGRYRHGGSDTEFTVVSVDETWNYLDEWRDTGDRAVAFGRIPLGAGELLPAGALDDEDPDEKRYMEASGNEGASYERSYHRAVIVLWPKRRTVDVLLQSGVVSALPHLKNLVKLGEGARPEALVAAERMVAAWHCDPRRTWRPWRHQAPLPTAPHRTEMISALVKLNEPVLLARFLGEVVTARYDGSENKALVAAARVLGDEQASAVFSALVPARMADHPGGCAELLRMLSGNPLLLEVAEAAVASLDIAGTKMKPQSLTHVSED